MNHVRLGFLKLGKGVESGREKHPVLNFTEGD
jgi:hypothetical protein